MGQWIANYSSNKSVQNSAFGILKIKKDLRGCKTSFYPPSSNILAWGGVKFTYRGKLLPITFFWSGDFELKQEALKSLFEIIKTDVLTVIYN